jgi:serine/threonine protein kinase
MCEYGFPESKNVSTEAKDLIKGILVCDPKRRMSPDDILNHPFLTNYEIPHSL